MLGTLLVSLTLTVGQVEAGKTKEPYAKLGATVATQQTEGYFMWEQDAAVGGIPNIDSFQYNSGGGLGPTVPGTSLTYGVLNYTMLQVSKKDFFTVRNDWMKDEHGTRYGFKGNDSSHSLGWTHNFAPALQVRPEVGYYRNYNGPAFDNGLKNDIWMAGFYMTVRFQTYRI